MKNRYDNLYLFIAFLPLFLLPLSLPFAAVLIVSVIIYGMHHQSQALFRKSLTPLTLALVFFIALASTQIVTSIFFLLSRVFNVVLMSNLALAVSSFMGAVEFVLVSLLIVGVVFAFIAVKQNKHMPFMGKITEFFAQAQQHKQEKAKKDESEEVVEE